MGRMGGIIRNLTKTPVNGPLLRTTKQAIIKDTGLLAWTRIWCRVGPVFIHPGDKHFNSVKTFIVPKAGKVELTSHITSQGAV